MELYCKNTITGLVPLYPSDFDQKRKLKLGEDYKLAITLPRNLGFHRKFMAMVNIGCENSRLNMPFDTYRRYMTIKAGYFKAYQTPKGIYYEALSLSFAAMPQDEFEEVYSKVLDKVIEDIGATSQDIESMLTEFM
jgi:hypothetical protein